MSQSGMSGIAPRYADYGLGTTEYDLRIIQLDRRQDVGHHRLERLQLGH